MWFCLALSFLYFILWLMAKADGNASDADFAVTLGAIWMIGFLIISEIRKGRKQ
jgi:hypothetical protein